MALRGGNFHGDLKRFARKAGLTLDEAHRGIAINLFSGVVDDTPVEEGTLRGNWNISTNKPDESTSASVDPSGAITKAKIKSHPMKAGEASFFTNALPYAEVAERGLWNGPTEKVTAEGFSRKAPAGMVRKNMARVEAVIRNEVGKAKRKKR